MTEDLNWKIWTCFSSLVFKSWCPDYQGQIFWFEINYLPYRCIWSFLFHQYKFLHFGRDLTNTRWHFLHIVVLWSQLDNHIEKIRVYWHKYHHAHKEILKLNANLKNQFFELAKKEHFQFKPSRHSSISWLQSVPLKPEGQLHVYDPLKMLVSQIAAELHGLEAQASLRWQKSPVLPGGHSQWKLAILSWHVPPCKQGEAMQSLTLFSQFFPS